MRKTVCSLSNALLNEYSQQRPTYPYAVKKTPLKCSRVDSKVQNAKKTHLHAGHLHAGQGFGLIELLLSLLIFSWGILGLASLSTQALQLNHTTYLYGLAGQQIDAYVEFLQAYPNQSLNGIKLNQDLPGAKLEFRQGSPLCNLILSWQDKGVSHSLKLTLGCK